jgi:hypothetical protein
MTRRVEGVQGALMNRTFICLFGLYIASFPLAIGGGQTSSQGQRTRGIPYVSGTGWQTCGGWNNSAPKFKLGYLIGHMEAINQSIPYLRQTMSGSAIKNLFEMPEGIMIEDYTKSLDTLCQDSRNSEISIANAFGVVRADLAGTPEAHDRLLRAYRCIGAAGDNADKLNECFGLE